MIKILLFRLATLCAACSAVGCASIGLFSKGSFPKSGPQNPAVRILGLWQAGEGPGIKRGASRGFSGQVLFFTRTSVEPVQVDGAVQIYVFDDQGSSEDQAKPIDLFQFSPGAWKAHLFKGPLGATYDVFIPYTRPGIHEAKCTLCVKYVSKEGVEVSSEMVNITLPGMKETKSGSSHKNHSGISEDESESGGESTDSDTPGLSRKTPARTRSMSQALPTPEEIRKMLNRKPAAVELTTAERRRLTRDATSRMSSENRSEVVQAGYLESGNADEAGDRDDDEAAVDRGNQSLQFRPRELSGHEGHPLE